MKSFILLVLFLLLPLAAQDASTNAPEVTPPPMESPTAVDATPPPPLPPPAPSAPALEDAPQPPAPPPTPKPTPAAPRKWVIPDDQPHFIGHRFYEKKAGGWGWIKKPDESWRNARWAALKETPRQFHAPHRDQGNKEGDHNHEYKLLGYFADYKVYDPTRDELLDVFVIQGYQSLGEQAALDRKPGPPNRVRSRKSGAFSRGAGVPSPDSDSF